ncbi:MBL fold metallo-hydrolase [Rhizobium deserti]|nr:MBL fold metallo-hydrolase [Rhizobium deserti]
MQDPHDLRPLRYGDFELTLASDGIIVLPAAIVVPDAPETERPYWLARLGGGWGSAPMSAHVPVLRKGDDVILVDAGSGRSFQDTAGNLVENLRLHGIIPQDVTKIVFTHMHPDHVGGMIDGEGAAVFANASYFVGQAEYAFWRDPEFKGRRPESLHAFADLAVKCFSAMGDSLTLLRDGQEVVEGLVARATPGHTPGHLSLHLHGGEGLFIVGDAITNPLVPFENPDWGFGFDVDRDIGVRTRKRLLDELAASSYDVLGYHWLGSGLGRVERSGRTYRFVAA